MSFIEIKHFTDSTILNDTHFGQETEKNILTVISEYKHLKLPHEIIFRQNGQNTFMQL